MSEHSWLDHYPENVMWDQKFIGKPLCHLIDETADRIPSNIAMDFMGKSWTYGRLQKLINSACKSFQELGVKKGVKVGLYMPNCPQFIIAFFAINKAGGTVVSYSPLYSERELLHLVEDSETDIMISMDLEALYPKIKNVVEQRSTMFDEIRTNRRDLYAMLNEYSN